MNLFRTMRDDVARMIEALGEDGAIPAGLDTSRISVEPPRDPAHGDMATNAAMVLAKPAAMKPRDLAALLVDRLVQSPGVREAEIAGPGFINLRLDELAGFRCRDPCVDLGYMHAHE